MRIATWNLKQATAPRKKVPELMAWADSKIQADAYVFTEAKVPVDAEPKLVAVENVNVPAAEVKTVYGPAYEPAPVKVTEAPTGTT